jgi:hypothetical protein
VEDPPGALGEELSFYRRLAPAASRSIRNAGFLTPDGTWGMPALGRLDENRLTDLLSRLTAGTWELMVHPGYPDPGHPFSGPERETELAALTSPTIVRLVRHKQIHLITFGELACAS